MVIVDGGGRAPAYVARSTILDLHLHSLTGNRLAGGHLFARARSDLAIAIQYLADIHLTLPETAAFLQDELTREIAAVLDKAG